MQPSSWSRRPTSPRIRWSNSSRQRADTHPSSHFRRQLIVTRATPEARYALLEGRLTVRRSRGEGSAVTFHQARSRMPWRTCSDFGPSRRGSQYWRPPLKALTTPDGANAA
ncbi:MAG: arylamine N-acetyltransferase [Phenylobacterium sp.]|uniref:arylamine N-acetyltransferase n=1 Tax=Phenylobacterium sp. TaxID=1871053 RepID=UPI001A2DA4E3|nr:arylamine N-acetyltransferase [Phenylobacterium sp.]